MEQSRKYLKTSSVVVLILGVLSFVSVLFELYFGELGGELSGKLNNAANSDAALQSAVLVGRIVVLSVAVLMLLPQIYIGIKGIRIAKKPDSSRAHIVWGIILIVLTAIRLLPPFLEFLGGQGETFGSFSEVCSIAVDVFVLFEYVKYAREVRNGV